MKIAVNTRFLLPGKLEGLGWYTHEIASRLVRLRPQDEFIFFFDRPFDRRFVYAESVRPLVLFPPARHPFLWLAWFEQAVPRALRQCGADVFFSPDSFLSLSAKTRTVMTLHDIAPLHLPEQIPFWPRHFYRHFMPRYARRADQIVAISEHTKRDIAQTIRGVSPAKIHVVPNGCRAGFVPILEAEKQAVRREFAAGQPYFFYAGTVHPRKNLHRLIRAFDQFKTRTGAPAKLLIGGRFLFQTGEIMAAWQAAEHRADVQFLGYLPEETLQKLTAAALALTYVSLSEGFGLPLLEAMHAETPIVAANATALPEVAGDAAILVDPFSENDIAAALVRVFADENLRRELIEKGRLQREKFSWDAAAGALADLIAVG